jgi:hypothetical protein
MADESLRIPLQILHHVMTFCRRTLGFGSDAMILMLCLSLWIPSRLFANDLEEEEALRKPDVRKVLENYETLKDASRKINEAMGPVILFFVLEGILFFSLTLKNVLSLNKSAVTVGFFFFSFITSFNFGAMVCKQVRNFLSLRKGRIYYLRTLQCSFNV